MCVRFAPSQFNGGVANLSLDGCVVNPFDAVDALKRSEDRTRYSN